MKLLRFHFSEPLIVEHDQVVRVEFDRATGAWLRAGVVARGAPGPSPREWVSIIADGAADGGIAFKELEGPWVELPDQPPRDA